MYKEFLIKDEPICCFLLIFFPAIVLFQPISFSQYFAQNLSILLMIRSNYLLSVSINQCMLHHLKWKHKAGNLKLNSNGQMDTCRLTLSFSILDLA